MNSNLRVGWCLSKIAIFGHQIPVVSFRCFLSLICLLVATQFLFAQSAEKWTLEKCIAYAMENNISVRQAALNAQINSNQLLQSKLNLLPSVDANVGYNLNYGNTLNPITYNFEPGNAQSGQISLQGNMLLFNGLQQIHTIRKAKYDLLASKFDYDNARNNIALSVASAYLQVLLNREIQQVAEKQKALTTSQKAVIESRIKAGASPETAVYEVDAQLSLDEASLVNATGTNTISVLSLKQLLQITDEQPFEIATPEVNADNVEGISELTSAGIYSKAVLTQPSIKSAEARLKSADVNRKIAIGYITPTLSGFFNLSSGYASNDRQIIIDTFTNQFRYEDKPLATQLNNNFRKVVGLSLSIPLFGKGQRFISISNAKLQQQIVKLDLENSKNKLRQDIEQAYTNANAAALSYLANKKSLEASQKAYYATETRYKAGAGSTFDLQQAKNNLAAAESQMIQAKYTYVFRLKVLDFYQGKPITLN